MTRPLAPEPLNADLPPIPNAPPTPWAVLHNQAFLWLWIAQVFSQLADKVYLVLVIALTTQYFQSATASISPWVATIMVVFTIPAVLFGSLAGVFVDRWSKKRVLILTNLWRAGLVILLPLSVWLWAGDERGFALILGITFGISTLTQFFAPAEQAAIPLLVERHQLLSANSFYTLTMMGALVVGFAIGEPLLSLAGKWGGFVGGPAIVSGCYGLAALALLSLKSEEQCQVIQATPQQFWADLREGMNFLKGQPLLRMALLRLVLLFSVMAALAVLLVRIAEVMPSLETDQFGFLLVAGAIGLGGGVLVLNTVGHRLSHSQWSRIGSGGMAVMLLGLGQTSRSLWLSLLVIAGMGAFAALIAIPMQTTVQTQTPEDLRGKIFGLQNNLINIALSLPLAVAGIAETLWGLKIVLTGLAVMIFLGLVWPGPDHEQPDTSSNEIKLNKF
ncbi:MFS transporter [Synechococcus sp. PCC 6312]|uniref:MFS transporter n=1 Tax=Synechococcus sp. (strain ATCC 27167 / PCC 6312) TaxID=195253 RepID=UPI00029F17B5|nr:MFS transporter [Synechococcus sp. PCC 6312]AFY61469.1 arabinose efflux permease family protein [Synechococcus sp. PCC 6312]